MKRLDTIIDFLVYGMLLCSIWMNITLLGKATIDNAVRWKVNQLENKRDSTASMAMQTLYQDSINTLLDAWVHSEE